MPEMTPQLQQQYVFALQNFTQALNSSSFGAGGDSRPSSRRGEAGNASGQGQQEVVKETVRLNKVLQDSTETMKQFSRMQKKSVDALSRDLEDYSTLSGRMFNEAVSKLDVHGLDRLAENAQEQLDKLGSSLASEIKSIDDLVAAQQRMAGLASRIGTEQFKRDHAEAVSYKKRKISEEDRKKIYADLGFTVEEVNMSMEELEKEVLDFTTALGKASKTASKDFGAGLSSVSQKLMAFSSTMGALLLVAEAAVKPIRDAAKHGVDLSATQFQNAVDMGMSFEELAALQGQYRQSIVSMGVPMEKYNSALEENMQHLDQSTASLKDAALIGADLAEQHRLLGGDFSNLGSYMKEQSQTFERMNKTISMTGEEFVELNKHLRSDTAIRGQMIRMTKERRRQYFEETQQLYEQLRLGGMTNDQAKTLISTLAELGGGGAKGRIQQAAKLQAVMGAAGMGGEGRRAGALLRGGLREEGDKKEFAAIMTKANEKIGQKMGGSLAQELAFGQMIESTGLEKLLGPGSMFQDAVIQQGLAIDKAAAGDAQDNAKLLDSMVKTKNATDMITAALKGEIAALLGGILLATSTMAGTSLFKGLGKVAGGKMGGNLGLKAGAKIAGGSGILAGVVGTGLEVAENWDRSDLSTGRKTMMAATRGGGALGGAAGGAALGAAIGSVVPILGTAIGGVIGGALGAWGGDYLGDTLTGWMDPAEQAKSQEAQYAAIQEERRETSKEQAMLLEQTRKLAENGLTDTATFAAMSSRLGDILEIQEELKDKEAELPAEVAKVAKVLNQNDENENQREAERKAEREFNKIGGKDVLIRRQGAPGGH